MGTTLRQFHLVITDQQELSMPSIRFAELEPLHRMAARMSRGLCRRLGLPSYEAEDFTQDLLADLLSRLPAFNEAQGTLGAFALTCFRHQSAELARRTQRQRAMRHPVSLDDITTDGGTVCAQLAEADGYSAWMGQPVDAFAAVERRIDLEYAAATFTAADAALCAALLRGEPDPSRRRGLSRTTAFRRVRELRLRLQAAGVTSAA